MDLCFGNNICGEGNDSPLQYSCPENPMDWGAWWAAVHGVAKSQTPLSDFTFTFHFHALEKEMATHSSVLAWRISGTEEPSGLLSMESHRVGHGWSNLAAAAATISVISWLQLTSQKVKSEAGFTVDDSLYLKQMKPKVPAHSVQLVQFSCSVMSHSLRSHGLQHARPSCPSPTPRAYSNSSPSRWWCYPTISSSVVPFSSRLQSFPGIKVFSSESILRIWWPKYWSFSFNISPSNEYSGLISFGMDWLDFSRVFSNTTVQKHQFFSTQLTL